MVVKRSGTTVKPIFSTSACCLIKVGVRNTKYRFYGMMFSRGVVGMIPCIPKVARLRHVSTTVGGNTTCQCRV